VLQKRYAFDGTGWPLVQYDAAGNRTCAPLRSMD
jgi:hypothetical protein